MEIYSVWSLITEKNTKKNFSFPCPEIDTINCQQDHPPVSSFAESSTACNEVQEARWWLGHHPPSAWSSLVLAKNHV